MYGAAYRDQADPTHAQCREVRVQKHACSRSQTGSTRWTFICTRKVAVVMGIRIKQSSMCARLSAHEARACYTMHARLLIRCMIPMPDSMHKMSLFKNQHTLHARAANVRTKSSDFTRNCAGASYVQYQPK
eukprot:3822210-Pleurochrysis_carterae.AAC.1